MIKLDGAIFDDKKWFSHYEALHTKKDDSKWDELNWLKEHLICALEFKKEGSKDVKGVFTSQLKTYMNESSKIVSLEFFMMKEDCIFSMQTEKITLD